MSSHRPELHITAQHGVLEAPAGALFTGEQWHVFHQYRSQPDVKKNNWGHVVSADTPFNWAHRDDVLSAEAPEVQVRAGSVVAPRCGDEAELFFTSVTDEGPSIHRALLTNLSGPQSDVRREGSVVDAPVLGIDKLQDFRSPCVVPGWADEDDRSEGHGGWLMLAVAGPMSAPELVMLSSHDQQSWTLDGPLAFHGDSGLAHHPILVSPRIIRLRDEVDGHVYDVLIVTVEADGVDLSGYLVGTLRGCDFWVKTPFTQMDFGHDFTRPRNTNTVRGVTYGNNERYDAALIFGLMNGVGRLDNPATHESLRAEGWANCLSLPRLTTLQGGLLFQTPTPGLTSAIPHTAHARMWSGLIDAQEGSVTVTLLDTATGLIAATITHSGHHLQLDRSMNPLHAGESPAEAYLISADTDSLTIIVDGSTVEVFADGGVIAMASRVYFEGICGGFDVTAEGGASILRYFEVAGEDV